MGEDIIYKGYKFQPSLLDSLIEEARENDTDPSNNLNDITCVANTIQYRTTRDESQRNRMSLEDQRRLTMG